MGKRFGLPQGYRASDAFADLYIDMVERTLVRRGLPVWRYSDDFRIGSESRSAAYAAIEELDDELRRVGLALNDDKTFVQSADTYKTWVNRAENLINELAQELQTDLSGWDPYNEEPVEPDAEEVWVAAAVGALTAWRDRDHESTAGPVGLANRRILTTALSILRTFEQPEGLPFCRSIVAAEPQLTPAIALYVSSVIEEAGDPARRALRTLVSDEDVYLNDWQRLWLLEPLKLSPTLTPALRTWVDDCYRSDSGAVSTSAASLLSAHGQIGVSQLLELYDRAGTANRPTLVYAVGLRSPETTSAQRKSVQEDFLSQMIFETAVEAAQNASELF